MKDNIITDNLFDENIIHIKRHLVKMRNYVIYLTFFLFISANAFSIDFVRHRNTGIKIIFKTNNDMFPESWLTDEINAQAESLNIGELKRSIQIIYAALNKYPTEFLKTNLKEIYIVKSLKFYGIEYGGTNSTDIVYITNQGIDLGYSNQYIEQLFHAEFWSIVLRNFADENFELVWNMLNNESFSYGDGGVPEIRNGEAGLEYSEFFFNKGFLYEYAMSGSENDFNSIAKNLFCPNYEFWKVYTKYVILTKKINLVIELYSKADEHFNLRYFRSFSH